MATVHVTGHRNPDLDSIGSAIGYAELMGRLEPGDRYVPGRLGEVNPQTRWALDRSGAPEPEFLPHVKLRVGDVMQGCAYTARWDEPIRGVGLAMAREGLDMVPVVGADGTLSGVLSERVLARLYVRDSQGASDFAGRPVGLDGICEVVGGEIVTGDEREISGRLWVVSMGADVLHQMVKEGDIAVVGNLGTEQKRALELGVELLVLSNGVRPSEDVVALAGSRGAAVIVSPLDTYVTARMVSLAVPCCRIMDREPLTVARDETLEDVTDRILEVDYRAGVVVDREGRPEGIVSRSDLVAPEPRRVVLVDHAEANQSVPGLGSATIVEILDHHHIGSIETRMPVRATFDPVGSTATLVTERFRHAGEQPSRRAAAMLLAAALSDTVVLTGPTTTDRDRRAAAYLGELLGVEPEAYGMEMFEQSSDVSGLAPQEIVRRDAKEYEPEPEKPLLIAQVEVVGGELLDRRKELQAALDEACADGGYAV